MRSDPVKWRHPPRRDAPRRDDDQGRREEQKAAVVAWFNEGVAKKTTNDAKPSPLTTLTLARTTVTTVPPSTRRGEAAQAMKLPAAAAPPAPSCFLKPAFGRHCGRFWTMRSAPPADKAAPDETSGSGRAAPASRPRDGRARFLAPALLRRESCDLWKARSCRGASRRRGRRHAGDASRAPAASRGRICGYHGTHSTDLLLPEHAAVVV